LVRGGTADRRILDTLGKEQVMVNWEQIINELELPELPNPIVIEGSSAVLASGKLEFTSGRWEFTSDRSGVVDIAIDLRRLREIERLMGPEQFQYELGRLADEAIEGARRRQQVPLDNDVL
jgi:hypothetical protein